MRRCGVLGDPIDHSLSPVLHRAGYAAAGLEWSYTPHRVAEAGLPEFLAGLDDDWRGLSLTMPLKRTVMGLATRVTETARLAGGANTLLFAEDGSTTADNTDVPGAAAALRERYQGPVTAATILGGGATATSLGMALAGLGATELLILVRSPERAAATVNALRALPAPPTVRVGLLGDEPFIGEVVGSTIPARAQTGALVAASREHPVLFEVIYHPWPTPLAAAVAADRTLIGGLDLLVHQAALQFSWFTGEPAPLATMRAAGEWALAQRG
ncbi:shikimate dehydrogenase [Nocardioides dubius]|uniref:Shikimate dehydrogenase n=1 Tax=Nocardioides dubius TaxID=317019 RepID=A0ABN1TMA4_9ACTN